MHLGLGQPPQNSTSLARPPQRNAYSSTFPQINNNELILYSYAQLVGTVLVAPEGTGGPATPTQDQVYRMNRIRKALLRRRVAVGGGSMDISQSLHSGSSGISSSLSFSGGGGHYTNHQQMSGGLGAGGYTRKKLGHGRSASFSASLMSLLSPAPSGPGSTPTPMEERAVPTSPGHLNGSVAAAGAHLGHKPASGPGSVDNGAGLGLGIVEAPSLGGSGAVEDIDPELPLPTFEAQPSMLAVDLSLPPGESRSCMLSPTRA
jgi:hypothetical protein